MSTPLLSVHDVRVDFPITGGIFKRVVDHVRAVRGVSFSIEAGEIKALVGESGCGKTTVGMAMLGLVPITGGRVLWQGHDLSSAGAWRVLRKEIQVVFQDPYASLNPRMRVRDIVAEGMRVHGIGKNERERDHRVASLLSRVGLDPEAGIRYPHEFSGGQRQRIAIARALAVEPKCLILDEAVSSLDVLVQAQILNLLSELRKEMNLTYLFITHDLGVVEYLADNVVVMYLGQVMEEGPVEQIFSAPRHPYTQALLAARPEIDRPLSEKPAPLKGDVPSARRPPEGCPFHTRCPSVMTGCSSGDIAFVQSGPAHRTRCLLEWKS